SRSEIDKRIREAILRWSFASWQRLWARGSKGVKQIAKECGEPGHLKGHRTYRHRSHTLWPGLRTGPRGPTAGLLLRPGKSLRTLRPPAGAWSGDHAPTGHLKGHRTYRHRPDIGPHERFPCR